VGPGLSILTILQPAILRFFGDDLAVLPEVDGRPVHPRSLAGYFYRSAKRSPDGFREFLAVSLLFFPLHFDRSSNRGVLCELSYTVQVSANKR